MTTGKKILLGIVLVLGLFFIYVGLQPSDYAIAREVSIDAGADVIFPYINNAKKMDSWSPWMELDPKVKVTFSGPEEGVGAKTSWESEGQLGVGSATIVESIPNSNVKTKLEYTKPFVMSQQAEFNLKSAGNQTVARWSVTGKNTFMGRVVCVFMDMDKEIGGTFEKGLNKLKTLAEGSAR